MAAEVAGKTLAGGKTTEGKARRETKAKDEERWEEKDNKQPIQQEMDARRRSCPKSKEV